MCDVKHYFGRTSPISDHHRTCFSNSPRINTLFRVSAHPMVHPRRPAGDNRIGKSAVGSFMEAAASVGQLVPPDSRKCLISDNRPLQSWDRSVPRKWGRPPTCQQSRAGLLPVGQVPNVPDLPTAGQGLALNGRPSEMGTIGPTEYAQVTDSR